MTTTEDDRMVEAVRMGDTQAFGGIVRKYEKPIFNLMYRATGSRDDAADLTQDAFLRAYDKIHTFRLGRKFYSWLYTLSLNVVRDHLRKGRRRPAIVTDQDLDNSAQGSLDGVLKANGIERTLELQHLFHILRTLPLKDREAVLLRFRDGLQMKEIAERLDLSVSGAKMRVHRGLAKLQKAMGKALS
jgi:RNA polymerase sigma-70 factor (ECF subfamily)